MTHRILPVFAFTLIAFATVPAADPLPELRPAKHPRGYVCHRCPKAIVIDGKHEDAWNAAAWSEEFVDIESDAKQKAAPRHKTRMKMLWDDEALYILAELEEPHVCATLKDHDSIIFHDNDFEVFLDPDGDNHDYGELEVNAFNTTWDLLLTRPYRDEGNKAIHAWEIRGLKTAVHVNGTLNDPRDKDKGWTLEIRWPYSGIAELAKMNIPPKDGEQWRINFSRVQWDHVVKDGKYVKAKETEDNWVWSPQGAVDMHRPERWGYLQFSTAEAGKASFSADPDWPTRDLLHRVYWAQRELRIAEKPFATDIGKLNLGGVAVPLSDAVRVEATKRGFEAMLERPGGPRGKPRRYVINQDGHLTTE